MKWVYVKWLDSAGQQGFVILDHAKILELAINESLGFLIHEDTEKIIIANTHCFKMDMDDREKLINIDVIAKKMILEMVEVAKKKCLT